MLLKTVSIVCAIAVVVAALTTQLYLGTRDKLTQLTTQYTQLQEVQRELSESKDKLVLSNQQDDTIVVDKIEAISAIDRSKSLLLNKLATAAKTIKCQPQKSVPNETVNLLASWDADTQRVLNEAYNNNKRTGSVAP